MIFLVSVHWQFFLGFVESVGYCNLYIFIQLLLIPATAQLDKGL